MTDAQKRRRVQTFLTDAGGYAAIDVLYLVTDGRVLLTTLAFNVLKRSAAIERFGTLEQNLLSVLCERTQAEK